MLIPDDRKYLDTHEWFQAEGDVVTIGITQFAATELTDITYVEVPAVGARFEAGDVLAEDFLPAVRFSGVAASIACFLHRRREGSRRSGKKSFRQTRRTTRSGGRSPSPGRPRNTAV